MTPLRFGLFPGAFNPPTNAHVTLIRAAAAHVHRVVAVIPRTFPHKTYTDASLEQRIEMLEAVRPGVGFDIRTTRGGLFIEIAREFREGSPQDLDLWFICGRDAAERIVGWDYGQPEAITGMLEEFGLLVAARQGEFAPPPRLAHRIRRLEIPPGLDDISGTEVRGRIVRGEPWEHLVPPAAVPLVRRYYGPPRGQSKSG
jgi:cytidyltransferase-like protein